MYQVLEIKCPGERLDAEPRIFFYLKDQVAEVLKDKHCISESG